MTIILLGVLYGCSDGGSSSTIPSGVTLSEPPPTSPVAGGGVKGPLANAQAAIYQLDPTASDLKGDQLGSGTTGTNAAIQGLTIPNGTIGALLLEVVADDDTIDITTGAAPSITQLRSVIDSTDLTGPLFVTPLTTLAVDLARTNADSTIAPYSGDGDGSISTSEYVAALNIAGAQVLSSLGFGLPSDTNLFLTRPVLTSDDDSPQKQQTVLAYRQAIEAVSAIVDLVVQDANANNPNSTLTADQVLSAVSADLSDGTVDGNDVSGPLSSLSDVSDIAAIASTDVTLLKVPGTTTLVSDIGQIVASEVATTGASVATDALTNGEIIVDLIPVRIVTDADGDGVADKLDLFPNDATESIDTDGDGVGNNADTDDDNDGTLDVDDAFPLNREEQLDTDGDTIGNNADEDDDGDSIPDTQDSLPLDPTESIDTDNDGIGNNADTDDDNDGTLDNLDAFPLDANEKLDSDGDGIGNNSDTDDDGDGVIDTDDILPLEPLSSTGVSKLITAAEGGTISSSDNRFSIEIPANALAQDVTIRIGDYNHVLEGLINFDGSKQLYFAQSDVAFNTQMNLTYQANFPEANLDRTPIPFANQSAEFVQLKDSVYDRKAQTVTVAATELSTFGLAYGDVTVKVSNAISDVGSIFETEYTATYFGGDPIGNKFVKTQGLLDDGTFSIQPQVVGADGVIDEVTHEEGLRFPGDSGSTSDTGGIFGECLKVGTQAFTFNLEFEDGFVTSGATTTGTQQVTINVTCNAKSQIILDPIYINVGPGIDRINKAGPPPYNGIACSEQLYVVVSDNQTLLTTVDGSCQASRKTTPDENNLGAVLLSNPGGDRLVTHTNSATSICPVDSESFCQLFRFTSQAATTDAKYARKADGTLDYEKVVTVSSGQVFEYSIDAAGANQETRIIAPNIGFVSYSPISDKQGIAVNFGIPSGASLVSRDTDGDGDVDGDDSINATVDRIGDVGSEALNIQCGINGIGCFVPAFASGTGHAIDLGPLQPNEFLKKLGITLSEPIPNVSTASPTVARDKDRRFIAGAANDKSNRFEIYASEFTQSNVFVTIYSQDMATINAKDSKTGEAVNIPTDSKPIAAQFLTTSEQLPQGGYMISIDRPGDLDDGLVVVPFTSTDLFAPILDAKGED